MMAGELSKVEAVLVRLVLPLQPSSIHLTSSLRTVELAHNPSSQSNQSQHQAQKAPETLTKRQRQNAARRERQKDVKADEEAQRIAALAKHKRELERVRMAEQLAAPRSKIGGGMKAAVDAGGKLVWE
jgi:hypothetical protein